MSFLKKNRSIHEMDLTSGHLFWKIPLFALPLALTTAFQLLYTTIDLWTVSTFGGGSTSMAAVGSNGALINLIITIFFSLSLGANVALSNAKGAGDRDYAARVLHTALILALVLGVGIGVFGFFVSPILLEAMGTIPSILEKATTYLKIYFLGAPFIMIYNYSAQMLRALGDSKRPLYILAISGIVNVLFDFLFVYFLDLDVAGVAWATVISQGVSALLAVLIWVFNKQGYVRLNPKRLKIDRRSLTEIIRIGLPAGIQGFAFSLPNVLIQSSLYTITNTEISIDDIVAGSSASGQIEHYIYAIIESISASCIAFVGQNYGARKTENIKKVFWYCQAWNLILVGLFSGLSYLFADPLLLLFIRDSEGINVADALAAGKQRLLVFALTYVLDGVMDIDNSYCRGMKYSLPPAIIILLGCTGTRILFLFTLFQLDYFHTVFWLYAAYPISWMVVILVYIPVIHIIQKKAFARIDKLPPIAPKTT